MASFIVHLVQVWEHLTFGACCSWVELILRNGCHFLLSLFHLTIKFFSICDRINTVVVTVDCAYFGKSLVKKFINFSQHLRSLARFENPSSAKKNLRIGQEPSDLEFVLVLPSLFIMVEYFKENFCYAYNRINGHTNCKDNHKSFHYGELELLTLHFQVGKRAYQG